ncbi:hypothetical protein PG988_009367 [Apiospora saccharicola]
MLCRRLRKRSCELSEDAKVALRNAAGAACGFTPHQFHYYLQAPVVKGGYDPGNPRHAVYASTIVIFAADMHAQRLPVEVSVADVPDGLAVQHDDIPPGIRWVRGLRSVADVHQHRCDFGYEAIPATVAAEEVQSHRTCVNILKWLVYTFDGSVGPLPSAA